MHRYFIKISWLIRWLFPSYVWRIPSDEKAVYLTFDDGPDPVATPWVLQELKKYDAPATFFCIGENGSAASGRLPATTDRKSRGR